MSGATRITAASAAAIRAACRDGAGELRERLIRAVAAAHPVAYAKLDGEGQHTVVIRTHEDAAAVAVDAMLVELGLRQEWKLPADRGPGVQYRDTPPGCRSRTRYVTEWTDSEGR